jgi:hypothetical protein
VTEVVVKKKVSPGSGKHASLLNLFSQVLFNALLEQGNQGNSCIEQIVLLERFGEFITS